MAVVMGRGGFSLISLLATLAIVGVVLLIAAPRLAALMPKARLEGAARNLATEIQRARFRAIAEGVAYRVTFDAGARTFRVCHETSSGSSVFTACDATKPIDDANAITLAVSSATAEFSPRGVTTQNTVATLRASGGGIRRVGTRTSGGVYVE